MWNKPITKSRFLQPTIQITKTFGWLTFISRKETKQLFTFEKLEPEDFFWHICLKFTFLIDYQKKMIWLTNYFSSSTPCDSLNDCALTRTLNWSAAPNVCDIYFDSTPKNLTICWYKNTRPKFQNVKASL